MTAAFNNHETITQHELEKALTNETITPLTHFIYKMEHRLRSLEGTIVKPIQENTKEHEPCTSITFDTVMSHYKASSEEESSGTVSAVAENGTVITPQFENRKILYDWLVEHSATYFTMTEETFEEFWEAS